jgi:hypothetical protein
MTTGSRLLRSIVALVFAGSAGVSGALTSDEDMSRLHGRIHLQDGKAVSGATVTVARGSRAEVVASTRSDSLGRYEFEPLPSAADYSVAAESEGYGRTVMSPISLEAGKTTTVDIMLTPATRVRTALASGESHGDAVVLTDATTTTVFSKEFLEALPLLGRVYQDALVLAPGVTDSDGEGNPNINGARAEEVQTLQDDADTTDPLTGTFARSLDLEAIGEIAVTSSGAPVSFGRAQGGFTELRTPSAANNLEGSVKLFYRTGLLDGEPKNPDDVTNQPVSDDADDLTSWHPFASIGGAILKDRLWYFVGLEYLSTRDTVDTLGGEQDATIEAWNGLAKLTWQINPSHRMRFVYGADPIRFEGLGLDHLTDPESAVEVEQGGIAAAIGWTYSLSPSWMLEMNLSQLDTGIDLGPATEPAPCPLDSIGRCNPFAVDLYNIDLIRGTTSGPYFSEQDDDRQRTALRADLSYFLEAGSWTHSIHGGFNAGRERYENRRTDSSIRFDQVRAFPFGGLFGTVTFLDFYPPSQTVESEQKFAGIYLEDAFKPIPNLAIRLGLRYDREEATSDGFTPVDPAVEAAEYLRLYEIGRGLPPGSATLAGSFSLPQPIYDINGDGLDNQHCSAYDIDGAVLGDGMPNMMIDDFFTYYDGDFDGVVDPNDPNDILLQAPDGISDGAYLNPSCDKNSDDTFFLISAFHRHQLDETGEPFGSLGRLDSSRGLPGTGRAPEEISIDRGFVSPRASIAWDPWSKNEWQLFGTWGRYYGTLPLEALIVETGPDSRYRTYDASDIPLGASAVPLSNELFSTTVLDRDLETPYTDEWTAGVEWAPFTDWTFALTYIHRDAHDLLQDVDVNHYTQDADGDGVLDDHFGTLVPSGFGGLMPAPDGLPDLFVLNPFFNQVFLVTNRDTSTSRSYQLQARRRMAHNWEMIASYVYSKVEGDAEAFRSTAGDDPSLAGQEFSVLAYDQTHVVKVSAVGYLPHGQTVGGILTWSSGLPFSIVEEALSLDQAGNPQVRAAYATGERNSERNEGIWDLDLSYRKWFEIDQVDLGFGVEAFNVLDTDDLTIARIDRANVQGSEFSRRFGRRWQLSLELHF